jgi:hypothetical protein
MGGWTLVIPLAFIATSNGNVQNPTDDVVNSLMDRLTERTLTLSPRMSVEAMQKTLKLHGVPPSQLQKLALTQFAATRNPSLQAQVREEFERLDPPTKAELRQISREAIARAQAAWGPKTDDVFGQAPKVELKLETMAGMTAPLASEKPWDPLGLAKIASQEQLYFYREAELKNGRVAMIAFLSIVLTDGLGVHPWFGTGDYVSAIQSHYFVEPYPKDFWIGLLVACGLVELANYPDRSKAPGDFGFDPLGFKPKQEPFLMEMQNKELNHGRLAMLGMAGIYWQEYLGRTTFR